MPIEADNHWPPLSAKKPPAVPVESLLAVGTLHLRAAAIPRGILRRFYEDIAGLTFVAAEGADVHFRQSRREIILQRDREAPGQVGFLIRQFDDALLKLRDRSIPVEVLHTDGGLTRTAIVRDPAGNWVHLIETRAF